MIKPQLTEQYGQVLRVSVVRASLKLRVSASAAVGEKPIATRLEPTSPAPLTRKNCLRFMSIVFMSSAGGGAQSHTACVTAEQAHLGVRAGVLTLQELLRKSAAYRPGSRSDNLS